MPSLASIADDVSGGWAISRVKRPRTANNRRARSRRCPCSTSKACAADTRAPAAAQRRGPPGSPPPDRPAGRARSQPPRAHRARRWRQVEQAPPRRVVETGHEREECSTSLLGCGGQDSAAHIGQSIPHPKQSLGYQAISRVNMVVSGSKKRL